MDNLDQQLVERLPNELSSEIEHGDTVNVVEDDVTVLELVLMEGIRLMLYLTLVHPLQHISQLQLLKGKLFEMGIDTNKLVFDDSNKPNVETNNKLSTDNTKPPIDNSKLLTQNSQPNIEDNNKPISHDTIEDNNKPISCDREYTSNPTYTPLSSTHINPIDSHPNSLHSQHIHPPSIDSPSLHSHTNSITSDSTASDLMKVNQLSVDDPIHLHSPILDSSSMPLKSDSQVNIQPYQDPQQHHYHQQHHDTQQHYKGNHLTNSTQHSSTQHSEPANHLPPQLPTPPTSHSLSSSNTSTSPYPPSYPTPTTTSSPPLPHPPPHIIDLYGPSTIEEENTDRKHISNDLLSEGYCYNDLPSGEYGSLEYNKTVRRERGVSVAEAVAYSKMTSTLPTASLTIESPPPAPTVVRHLQVILTTLVQYITIQFASENKLSEGTKSLETKVRSIIRKLVIKIPDVLWKSGYISIFLPGVFIHRYILNPFRPSLSVAGIVRGSLTTVGAIVMKTVDVLLSLFPFLDINTILTIVFSYRTLPDLVSLGPVAFALSFLQSHLYKASYQGIMTTSNVLYSTWLRLRAWWEREWSKWTWGSGYSHSENRDGNTSTRKDLTGLEPIEISSYSRKNEDEGRSEANNIRRFHSIMSLSGNVIVGDVEGMGGSDEDSAFNYNNNYLYNNKITEDINHSGVGVQKFIPLSPSLKRTNTQLGIGSVFQFDEPYQKNKTNKKLIKFRNPSEKDIYNLYSNTNQLKSTTKEKVPLPNSQGHLHNPSVFPLDQDIVPSSQNANSIFTHTHITEKTYLLQQPLKYPFLKDYFDSENSYGSVFGLSIGDDYYSSSDLAFEVMYGKMFFNKKTGKNINRNTDAEIGSTYFGYLGSYVGGSGSEGLKGVYNYRSSCNILPTDSLPPSSPLLRSARWRLLNQDWLSTQQTQDELHFKQRKDGNEETKPNYNKNHKPQRYQEENGQSGNSSEKCNLNRSVSKKTPNQTLSNPKITYDGIIIRNEDNIDNPEKLTGYNSEMEDNNNQMQIGWWKQIEMIWSDTNQYNNLVNILENKKRTNDLSNKSQFTYSPQDHVQNLHPYSYSSSQEPTYYRDYTDEIEEEKQNNYKQNTHNYKTQYKMKNNNHNYYNNNLNQHTFPPVMSPSLPPPPLLLSENTHSNPNPHIPFTLRPPLNLSLWDRIVLSLQVTGASLKSTFLSLFPSYFDIHHTINSVSSLYVSSLSTINVVCSTSFSLFSRLVQFFIPSSSVPRLFASLITLILTYPLQSILTHQILQFTGKLLTKKSILTTLNNIIVDIGRGDWSGELGSLYAGLPVALLVVIVGHGIHYSVAAIPSIIRKLTNKEKKRKQRKQPLK